MVNRIPERDRGDSWELLPAVSYLSEFQVEMYGWARRDEDGMGWYSEAMTVLEGERPWHGMARGFVGEYLRFGEICGPYQEIAQALVQTIVVPGGLEVCVAKVSLKHPVWGSSRAVDAAVAGGLMAGGAGVTGALLQVPEQVKLGRGIEDWQGTALAEELGLSHVDGVFHGVGGPHVLPVLLCEMTKSLSKPRRGT